MLVVFSLEIKDVILFKNILNEIANDCEIKNFQMLTLFFYRHFRYLCSLHSGNNRGVFLTSSYQNEIFRLNFDYHILLNQDILHIIYFVILL